MSDRLTFLLKVAKVAIAVLMVKVLLSIVLEYRSYLPPDFESAFLTGRRESFWGLYAVAFYTHLLCGPLTIVLAVLLWSTAKRPAWRAWHRRAGRVQGCLVLGVLVPSGLVMAGWAFAGPWAAWGFACLSVATGLAMAMTICQAWRRQFGEHQRWAQRTLVLLVSPLLLRVVSGALLVLDCESEVTYRVNAWLSWLVPLVALEVWSWWQRRPRSKASTAIASQYSLVRETVS